MAKTSIEWTDASWNPVTGCSEVSSGCANCYAAKLAATRLAEQARYKGLAVIGDNGHAHWTGEVRLHPDRLDEPLKWRKPSKIFVCDMSDTFHADVPDEFLDRLFAVMALCPQHTFQVLTKRPQRMRDYLDPPLGRDRIAQAVRNLLHTRGLPAWDEDGVTAGEIEHGQRWPLPNVWLGTSVEDQARADERIPHLLATPAAVRFLSCEPLLGPVDVSRYLYPWSNLARVGWVIAGGESGSGARPCRLGWLRSLVEQCKAAAVPAFVKQLGSNPQAWGAGDLLATNDAPPAESRRLFNVRHPKGGSMDEWPLDLRVRQFPQRKDPPC